MKLQRRRRKKTGGTGTLAVQLTARISSDAYRERYGEYPYNNFFASFSEYLRNVAMELELANDKNERLGARGVYHFRGVTIDASFGMIQNPTSDYVAYATVRLATCESEQRLEHVAAMLTRQIPELSETKY